MCSWKIMPVGENLERVLVHPIMQELWIIWGTPTVLKCCMGFINLPQRKYCLEDWMGLGFVQKVFVVIFVFWHLFCQHQLIIKCHGGL